jgi:hypothetical protein
MKTPQPERSNLRILQVTRGLLLLPWIAIKALCVRFTGLCRPPRTKKQQDAADDLRQSRIRRELRGLPPDHV